MKTFEVTLRRRKVVWQEYETTVEAPDEDTAVEMAWDEASSDDWSSIDMEFDLHGSDVWTSSK